MIELYFGAACDLLNDKKKVSNVLDQWGGSNFGAFGLAEIEITGTRDIAKLIKVRYFLSEILPINNPMPKSKITLDLIA